MAKNKAYAQGIKLPIVVAVLAASLIASGMNLAEAVPMGAKQFGSKTIDKMKIAAIKQDMPKVSEKKVTFPTHKGTQAELKSETVKIEKKLIEQQKAIEKLFKLYYKNPYQRSPYR
jgi:electron transfer flavoprotein alpha/beta subunit